MASRKFSGNLTEKYFLTLLENVQVHHPAGTNSRELQQERNLAHVLNPKECSWFNFLNKCEFCLDQ